MSNKLNDKKNIFSIFFNEFLRIRNVLAWTLVSFVGFIFGISSLDLGSYIIPFFVFFVSFFFIVSVTFSLNNYFDVDSDRINPRRKNINAIEFRKISKQTVFFLNIIFIFISLIVTFLYKFEIFLFSIFLLFLGLAYSIPPFRIKGRPVLDVIWHFLGFFSFIIYGSFIAGSIELISWLMAISLGVWSSIGQVGNHIEDYSSDKSSGTKTFAVWAGLDKAKITINFLTLLHLIVLIPLIIFYTIDYYASFLFFIVIALLGLIILKPRRGAFPTKNCWIFYFSIVIGGAVYVSILIYHIYTLLNIHPFDILKI